MRKMLQGSDGGPSTSRSRHPLAPTRAVRIGNSRPEGPRWHNRSKGLNHMEDAQVGDTQAPKRQLQELSVDECLTRLQQHQLGRLVYTMEDELQIRPLNYALYQGQIIIRTGYGDLLDAVDRQSVLFEVDDAEPPTSSPWSVIVRGVAEEIWRPDELQVMRDLPLRPWAPGSRDHYLRIISSAMTGRRLA